MRKLIVTVGCSVLCIIALTGNSFAKNCTKDQRDRADAMLLDIAASTEKKTQLINEHLPFGVPRSNVDSDNSEQLLVNRGYIEMYDSDLKTGLWSAFQLTSTDIINASGKERINCFRPDPRIKDSPIASDYIEPLYDMGHNANDASMKDELLEQINTYVLSNISPQSCALNRGIWLTMENTVRAWASKYGSIFVITGSIFDRNNDNVRDEDSKAVRMVSNNGSSRVAVPNEFFKVIYRKINETEYAVIALTFENNTEKHGTKWSETKPYIDSRITSIAKLEDKVDISFFPNLHTKMIEDRALWDFSKNSRNMEYTCK